MPRFRLVIFMSSEKASLSPIYDGIVDDYIGSQFADSIFQSLSRETLPEDFPVFGQPPAIPERGQSKDLKRSFTGQLEMSKGLERTYTNPEVNIVRDNEQKQERAQSIFKQMSVTNDDFFDPINPDNHESNNGTKETLPAAHEMDKGDLIPSVRWSTLVSDNYALKLPAPPSSSPEMTNIKRDGTLKRLESLGIFELSPTPKLHSRSSKREVYEKSVANFSTPSHQKAEKVSKIKEITGPQLVSTSSRVETVPLADILSDMRAAGKFKEDKERGFFGFKN
jgi:hypothetical protein